VLSDCIHAGGIDAALAKKSERGPKDLVVRQRTS
jgi:hypothetical protein